MLYVDNGGIEDAQINLALEEHVLRNRLGDERILLFYVNRPAVIIGRNQNTIEEVNAPFIEERGVRVVRRISGGGAVYHDTGNLNFSFIAPYDKRFFNNYDEFTRPIVEVLRELGIPAELGGRNDITADGRKISGNAQFATPERMFSHGTLLFDSNLDDVTAALNVKAGKIESKGVKSVRSRVANISEFLREPLTVADLRERILARIFPDARPTLALTDEDWRSVYDLVETKYGNWNWNYGQSPAANVQRAERFPNIGEIDVRLDVQDGRIASIRIFGDFMGQRDVAELEALLSGVRYERTAVARALEAVDASLYFGNVTIDDVVRVIVD